jgi:hypothetical protein
MHLAEKSNPPKSSISRLSRSQILPRLIHWQRFIDFGCQVLKMVMRLICLCSAVLIFTACKKNGDGDNSSSPFPNKIGDSWTYHVQDTTWNNNQPANISNYTMTVSVIGAKILTGGIVANVWVYSRPGQSDTCYVTTMADTIRFVDIHEFGLYVFSRQYIIPIALNNSWAYLDPYHPNDVRVDSQASILVEQMEFDSAFHISGFSGVPDSWFQIDEWVANNVGTVKRYYNSVGMNTAGYDHTISWSLMSYNLR